MTIGLIAVAISQILGIVIGGVSGYFGGLVDTVIQRIVHVRKITRVARRHTQARWATGALAGVSKERTKQ